MNKLKVFHMSAQRKDDEIHAYNIFFDNNIIQFEHSLIKAKVRGVISTSWHYKTSLVFAPYQQ